MTERGPKEPHIYYDIDEILKFTKLRTPKNRFVQLLGEYKGASGDHYLHTFQEHQGQDIMKVALNMSLVEQYPVHETLVQVFGSLDIESVPAINVFFYIGIPDNHDEVCSYLNSLRSQKQFL